MPVPPTAVPVLSAAAVPVAVAVPVAPVCPDAALDVRVAVAVPVPEPLDDPVAVACPLELPPPFPFAAVDDWKALAALKSSLARLSGLGGSGLEIPCGNEYTLVHCVKERRNMS